MPFFSRNEVVEEPAPPAPEPKRSHGLFGSHSHRDVSPVSSRRASSTTYHTSPERASSVSTGRRSLLHRTGGNGVVSPEMDPSIVQARERVMSAEAAERDADRALIAAREQVREAREHVRKLELEAQEEARRAKIKQYHAREVSKRGKMLGRHGP